MTPEATMHRKLRDELKTTLVLIEVHSSRVQPPPAVERLKRYLSEAIAELERAATRRD